MKAICIAVVFAALSTPALARQAHHYKHIRHLQTELGMSDGWQPFAWSSAGSYAGQVRPDAAPGQGAYAEMVARHAAANGVPASLVHRVIMRESRYNPRAVSKGNYGMMQIRLGTARAMGFTGSASGLLDPEVNMTYAVKYLAGTYQASGGSEARAVANYARGYRHQGRRENLSSYEGSSSAFEMQTFPQSVRASRTGFVMMADRHTVF
jgi:soluble lytic murein transglycosylase-like protein